MSEHEPQPEDGRGPEDQAQAPTPPRVWIGSLADYNAGHLHGGWVDAAVPDDELREAAERIVYSSLTPGAEEWAIFDHEGFGDLHVGEGELLEVVAAVARGIAEHGLAFAAWAEVHDMEPDALAGFSDAYLGEYDSAAAWAEEICADLGIEEQLVKLSLPGGIAGHIHIDYAAIANDARLSGDIYVAHHPGGVWIFDGRSA